MTPTKNESLPELPNTEYRGGNDVYGKEFPLYTADQMHAYAYAALTREAPTEGVAEYQYRCPKASDDGWRRMTLEQYEATLATGNACGERGWTRDVEVRRLYATPPAPQRQSSNPSGLSSESAALSSEQRLAQGEDARYVEDGDLLWLSRRLGVIDRDYGIHVVKRGGTGDVGDLLSFVTYMRGCNDV